MSRRDSMQSLNTRQNDALAEFESSKKEFLLANNITKLNSTLSVRIEELQAEISTLYVENMRLRASEIALTAQLKKEQEKSSKVLADAEAASADPAKNRFFQRSFNVPPSMPLPTLEPKPPSKAPRPILDLNTSLQMPRPSGALKFPKIYEDDEAMSSPESEEDDIVHVQKFVRRGAEDKQSLPFPLPAPPSPLPILRHIDPVRESFTKKKSSQRQSELLLVNTNTGPPMRSERPKDPIHPRAASPAFGLLERRNAGLAEDEAERQVDETITEYLDGNMQEGRGNDKPATDASVYTSTTSVTTSNSESLAAPASAASANPTIPSTSSSTSGSPSNPQRQEPACSFCAIARCVLHGFYDLLPISQRPELVQHPIAPHVVGGDIENTALVSWADEIARYLWRPESVPARTGSFTGETINVPLQWLHDSSYTETHETLAALYLPGTCSWLYDTDQYAIWLSRNDHFLWLQGKAGSGKSILAYSVIEHLKKLQAPVMFFYCNHRDDSCASAAQVMRSLLYQMLQYFCKSSGMQAAGMGLISDILEQSIKGIHNDHQRLPSLVACAAQNLRQPPFVIIDALDECKDVERLLEALAGWSKWGKMRIFVTSHPLQLIKEKLVDVHPKSVISWGQFQKWASSDITKFISKELDTWKWQGETLLVDGGRKEKIISILSEKAQGVFPWAKCQLDILGRCSDISEIQETLNKLPPPAEFFDRIILGSDIQKVGSKFVHRILAWLVCALQPIRLCEIVEALMIDIDQRTMAPERIRQAIKNPVSTHIPSQLSLELEIGNALLHVLGGLVMHNEETGFITLLHPSLRIYLTDPSANPQHQIDLQDAHEEITATCMCYLSLCLRDCLISINDKPPFRITSNGDAQQSQLHCTGSPLLDYVLANSFHHLLFLLPGNEAILGDMSALESDLQQYPDGWEYLRKVASHSRPWPSTNHDFTLYTLIAFSPDWLLRVFLDCESLSHRLQRCQGTNPLIYAAHFRAVDQAKTLLSRGAGLHDYGWLVDDSRQALPLVAAVKGEGKSTMILDLFLEWQTPIPAELFTDVACNPSSYAPPIVRRLLQTDDFVGWMEHHQGQNFSFHSFLPAGSSLADEEEFIAIIWRLVQVGLDPHIPDAGGSTVLHLASEKDCVSLVEYLVSIGVRLPDDILFSALKRENLDARTGRMIRYLLREGADANSRLPPVTGDTVLHSAIKNAAAPSHSHTPSGLIEVVMALVDSGCDVNVRNPENYTPLHLAIIGGHVPVVKYLFGVTIPLPEDLSFALSLAPPFTQEEIREILARRG